MGEKMDAGSNLKLEETPLNWAVLNLLNEWYKQEKEQHYKVARLRPLMHMVAGALRMEAYQEPDTEELEDGPTEN